MATMELPTVPTIDLKRYTGTWYEIARFPNRFEKGLKCVTANYGIRDDGKIEVVNTGHLISDPSKIKKSTGKAWAPDPKFPARLKVQFFWPFSGDYYIMELDKDYQYALIGEPRRKYLWVLCRTRQIDPTIYKRLTDKAKSLGFDVNLLEKDEQDCQ